MSSRDCDVLVIGAGPTGLMAATLLRRGGVGVRIVEKRGEASRESRAFAVQARTLELFQSIGLVDALLDRGVMNTGVDIHVGGRQVGGLDFDRAGSPDTPFPFILMLPQSETEAILIGELARQGVAVERGIEVAGIEQEADGVVTRGTAAGGEAVAIRSAYAIGADGAHSVVRKALGLTFLGAPYEQRFLLADCRVDWALDHDRFRVFAHGERIGLFLPLRGRALSRVMAADIRKGEGEDGHAAPMALADLQAAFSEAAGIGLTLHDPVWTSGYRIHHRGVNRYRVGRVFVAGDAAHIHSPAGGQGMNTGLQDAANLAWKLTAALRGGAGDALLDSYDAERRPVGEAVLAQTDRLFSLAAGRSGWQAGLRDLLAPVLLGGASELGAFQRKAFRTVSEIGLRYGEGGGEGDRPGAGERAPDAAITRHRRVFDLIGGYAPHFLLLSRRPLGAEEVDGILAGLNGLPAHLVTRLAAGRDPRVVVAETAAVFEAYGLHEPDAQAVLAIRPDGYVAWRGRGLDLAGARLALGRLGLGAGRPGE